MDEMIVDGHSPILRHFTYQQNVPAMLQEVNRQFRITAWWMEDNLPAGPEKSVVLRKLLEAKDAAVRSASELDL